MRVGAGGVGRFTGQYKISNSCLLWCKEDENTNRRLQAKITKRFIFPGLRHGLSSSSAVTWKKYPNDTLFQSLFIFGSEDVRLLGPASKHPRRCGPRSKPDGFAPMWFDRRIACRFKSSMSSMSFCHKSRPLWCDSVIPWFLSTSQNILEHLQATSHRSLLYIAETWPHWPERNDLNVATWHRLAQPFSVAPCSACLWLSTFSPRIDLCALQNARAAGQHNTKWNKDAESSTKNFRSNLPDQ